jgi:hypothetical protein
MGHMQFKQIKCAQMKQKLGEEYLNRKKIIWTKVKLKEYDKILQYLREPSTNF